MCNNVGFTSKWIKYDFTGLSGRLYSLQQGLSLDKKSKEAIGVLTTLMTWLETTKTELKHLEVNGNFNSTHFKGNHHRFGPSECLSGNGGSSSRWKSGPEALLLGWWRRSGTPLQQVIEQKSGCYWTNP